MDRCRDGDEITKARQRWDVEKSRRRRYTASSDMFSGFPVAIKATMDTSLSGARVRGLLTNLHVPLSGRG